MSDDPNDEPQYTTKGNVFDRLNLPAEMSNAVPVDLDDDSYFEGAETVIKGNGKEITLEDWKEQTSSQIKPSNNFVYHLTFSFPDWLQQTFGDKVEIDNSNLSRLEIWLNKQWAGRVIFNNENPAYVYLNLIAVQDDITSVHQSLSGQAEFKKGPANMQTTSRKTYAFWLGRVQDYDVLKKELIRIADRVQLPWNVPNVGREKILEIMEIFDREERANRGPGGWYDWENSSRVKSGKYKYAIRNNGLLYPPRHIFNMAAGGKQDYTTDQARRYLNSIGFEVITLENSEDSWPKQVEGPCFVLMHQHEDELQQYGATYTFNTGQTGGKKDLYEALQAQKAGGPAVSAIIYLPGNHPLTGKPHKAFTAWVRVKDWEPKVEGETTHVIASLEHHEFPIPLYIKGNGADLVGKLDWLHDDLSKTFWQRAIRRISDTDFKIIIEEAKIAAGNEMALGDAAYAVLFEAEGSLPLPEIIERVVKQGLLNQPPKATDLANALLVDDRFWSLGDNRWDLANRSLEPALPDAFETLEEYWDFADTLQMGQGYTAQGLHDLARDINPETNAESFVMGLRQLRLMRFNPTTSRYELQPYATSDGADFKKYVIFRIMVLGLLAGEKADDTFNLPAREIIPRIYNARVPQPATSFAPELKWENDKLLSWYAEAALVGYDTTEREWKGLADALADIGGDTPAVLAYNRLVNALRTAYLEGWASPDQGFGPLSQVGNLAEKLRELQREVLVDDQTVLRIYRSLLAGRNVILSGPPGTGKSLLAERLPEILWRQEQNTSRPGLDPDGALTLENAEMVHGYRSVFVTATEDWSVRDVIGGISPRLGGTEAEGKMTYDIRYGALTGTVLKNYKFTEEGKKLPVDTVQPQRDFVSETDKRYRGAWLVIDEFNRAHIDAAFGSLLTTLSGKAGTTLSVPSRGTDIIELRMPDDFRIIGTLNSFDRHFLNQISEALKRRFDFIDILPPRPDRYEQELLISMQKALGHLHRNKLAGIQIDSDKDYYWPGVVEFMRDDNGWELSAENPDASKAIEDFRRIFAVIRFFRKLGTAQVVAVLTNLFTGVLVGMSWADALDLALADSLADQLQVLTPDEQGILESYLENAGNPTGFAKAVQAQLPGQKNRRSRVVSLLREADIRHNGVSTIDPQSETSPTDGQLVALFRANEALTLPNGYFLRRLRDLNSDRGI